MLDLVQNVTSTVFDLHFSEKSSIRQGVCGNIAEGQYTMSVSKDGHITLSVSGVALTGRLNFFYLAVNSRTP